jgi:acylphosphatase
MIDYFDKFAGRGSVWLERLVRDQEVDSSSLSAPTYLYEFPVPLGKKMRRLHIIYQGKVQGIGFRFTIEHIAEWLKLTGWVKNRRDGSVEIIVEGEEEQLNLFLEQIKDSFASYIKSKEIDWQDATGEFSDFRITF